jgi:hypothetical protein
LAQAAPFQCKISELVVDTLVVVPDRPGVAARPGAHPGEAVGALAGARVGREQAARAVDQHMDRPAAREHGRRERAYLGGVAHVRA